MIGFKQIEFIDHAGTQPAPSGYPQADRPGMISNSSDYHVSLKVSCRSRGELLEFCVLKMPLPPGVGIPGLFNTWKKSALKRSLARSVRENVLNSDAERLNAHGAGKY